MLTTLGTFPFGTIEILEILPVQVELIYFHLFNLVEAELHGIEHFRVYLILVTCDLRIYYL